MRGKKENLQMAGSFNKFWTAVCLRERERIRVFAGWEKGYDLPVEDSEREEAEAGCKAVMESTAEIYKMADKGMASNVVLSSETLIQMKEVLKETGHPVISSETLFVMEDYEKMENFLINSIRKKAGSAMESDAVMTHLLTVRFLENGQIQYLSNRILDDGLEKIPDYQYRIRQRD